jgi:hypothetical protein
MKTYKVTVDEEGTKRWYNEKAVKYHREDGPAIEYSNGTKFWYLNGKRHRENGPAIEWFYGDKFWYINGERLTEEEFNNRTKPCIGKKVVIDGIEYTLK